MTNRVPPTFRLRPLSDATPKQTAWLVPGLIPLGFPTLVAGVGGLGKSTWVVARAAEGSVAETPWDTVIVSYEDTAEEVLRPRLEAAGGDAERVHEMVIADADSLDSLSLPGDIEELRRLIQSVSARLVVIDPIVAAVDAKLDAYKDQHVRQVLAQLYHLARDEDCAMVMIGHLNRVPSADAYLRIANSMAFWNAARSVVLITDDGDPDGPTRLVAQRKANLARLAPVQRHRLDEHVLAEMVDPETGRPIVTSRMVFVEIADDVNPGEILDSTAPTKIQTAEGVLAALLADGEWKESSQLKEVLEAAGFNDRLAKRAANALSVEVKREGFPSFTWWRLPVGTPTVGTPLHSENVPTVETTISSGSRAVAPPVGTVGTNHVARQEDCAHDARWLARDGVRRCVVCEPPAFPREVVA